MRNKNIEFIYWFAYYNLDSPSVRYRAKYPLDFFRNCKGIESYLIIPGYSLSRIFLFLKAYFSALFFRRKNSLIVIQRVQSHFIYSTLLKLLIKIRNKDTVYDLDDADYLEVDPDTIYYFAKNCEKISSGSKQIGEHLSRFNNQIVFTSSPIVDLNILKKRKNSIFTIGWIGIFKEHRESMTEIVFPALKELTFQLKLIIIGVVRTEDNEFIKTYFNDCSNIELEIPSGTDWNDEKNIQNRIASFDIGIATLTNTEMQISKSGIKAKQYLNNGIPVLSTNLPENNNVVIDCVNGYFCSSPEDFKKRIIEFYDMNETDYLCFSKRARESVCNFDHNNYFNYFEILKNGV